MYLQTLILELQRYWAERGCLIVQPLDLEVVATDPDNIPARRAGRGAGAGGRGATPETLYRPTQAVVASSGAGIRFSWIVYRGSTKYVT